MVKKVLFFDIDGTLLNSELKFELNTDPPYFIWGI